MTSKPGTAAVAQANGHDIYIDPAWINGMNLTQTMALLVHELTHNITGKVDDVLQDSLGVTVGAASQNISDKIQKGCFK